MYEYAARVESVYDGDTCKLNIDLGFRVYIKEYIRIAHINAPELNEANGARAKQRLEALLREGSGNLIIRTTRDRREKYGRMLAVIINESGLDVGQTLIDEGLARAYEGGRR